MGVASNLILLCMLFAAAASDILYRKISNRLIIVGVVLSLMLALGSFRIGPVIQVLVDLSLPVIILFLLYLCGVIGAGDIKLFSIISGFSGILFAFLVMMLSFVIGALWSLVLLVKEKALLKNLQFAIVYIAGLCQGKIVAYDIESKGRARIEIPFSVCILCAVVICLLVKYACMMQVG